MGISFEQQSQRYVRYKEDRLEYVMPKTWEKAGMRDEYDRPHGEITLVYRMALEAGIPAEDARFVLPNATPTNFQVMVNFTELLHIADLRLCWRAQWEIRHMVALMRREMVKAVPGPRRICSPSGATSAWATRRAAEGGERCPLGKVRPHKEQISRSSRSTGAGTSSLLGRPTCGKSRTTGTEE